MHMNYTVFNATMFEDIKRVIRCSKSKKDSIEISKGQRNKRKNNNLQNTTQKTKDLATQKTGMNSCASED